MLRLKNLKAFRQVWSSCLEKVSLFPWLQPATGSGTGELSVGGVKQAKTPMDLQYKAVFSHFPLLPAALAPSGLLRPQATSPDQRHPSNTSLRPRGTPERPSCFVPAFSFILGFHRHRRAPADKLRLLTQSHLLLSLPPISLAGIMVWRPRRGSAMVGLGCPRGPKA